MSSDDVVSRSRPYVAGPQPDSDAWATEAAQTGKTGTHKITGVGHTVADQDVAAMLGIGPGTPVIVRRRLVLLDGEPVETADAYYPPEIADGTGLASPGKIPGGAARLLADLGHAADRVHEEITARLPDDGEQETLGLRYDEPVLIVRRTSYNADGTPFEAAIMVMRADRRVLAYDLRGAA